jgi:hypothetical protein
MGPTLLLLLHLLLLHSERAACPNVECASQFPMQWRRHGCEACCCCCIAPEVHVQRCVHMVNVAQWGLALRLQAAQDLMHRAVDHPWCCTATCSAAGQHMHARQERELAGMYTRCRAAVAPPCFIKGAISSTATNCLSGLIANRTTGQN